MTFERDANGIPIIGSKKAEGNLTLTSLVIGACCIGEVMKERVMTATFGDSQTLAMTFANYLEVISSQPLTAGMEATLQQAVDWVEKSVEAANQFSMVTQLHALKESGSKTDEGEENDGEQIT